MSQWLIDEGPATKHMHKWFREAGQKDFDHCDCGAPPPDFAKDMPRGVAAAANGWPDWVAYSGLREDGKR